MEKTMTPLQIKSGDDLRQWMSENGYTKYRLAITEKIVSRTHLDNYLRGAYPIPYDFKVKLQGFLCIDKHKERH